MLGIPRLGGLALLASMALLSTGGPAPAEVSSPQSPSREEANTKLVLAMWHGVIEKADDQAVMRYVAPDYIQHNVNVPSGRDSLLKMLKLIRNPPPGFKGPAHKNLLRTVAQGDFVVVIWNQDQPSPRSPGQSYVGQSFDMFRIKNGKVAEHWDDTRMSPSPWVERPKV